MREIWDNLFEELDNNRGIANIVFTVILILLFFINYGIYKGIMTVVVLITPNEAITLPISITVIVLLFIGSCFVLYFGNRYIKYHR